MAARAGLTVKAAVAESRATCGGLTLWRSE
jgi:hypothetical protein